MGASWSAEENESKPKPKRAARKNRKAKSDIFDNFSFDREDEEPEESEEVEQEFEEEPAPEIIMDDKVYPSSVKKRTAPKNRTKGVRFSKAKKSIKRNYY